MVYKVKNFFVISMLTMAVLPAFATGISSSATSAQCVEPTLGVFEGTSNLQAQWEANTVPLRWYNNHTLIALAANDDANDCGYGSALDTPTNPSRTGYTFAGWKVNQQMNFSQIATDQEGTERWAKSASGVCHHDDAPTTSSAVEVPCTGAAYTELNPAEWRVNFTFGDVYGMAKCSSTNGNYAVAGTPSDTDGQYCWCKATTYKPANQSTVYRPLSSLAWVFFNDYGSASYCADRCAAHCAFYVRGISAFRAAVFAPAN